MFFSWDAIDYLPGEAGVGIFMLSTVFDFLSFDFWLGLFTDARDDYLLSSAFSCLGVMTT